MSDLRAQIIENEANLIGAIIAASTRDELRGFALLGQANLTTIDFKDPRHQTAWDVITRLLERGLPPNTANIYSDLTLAGASAEVQRYILDLRLSAPETFDVTAVVASIRIASALRQTYALGGELQASVAAALEGGITPVAAIDYCDKQLDAYTGRRISDAKGTPMSDLIDRAQNNITAQNERDGGITGVSTGIDKFDEFTGGLQPNALTLVAALSGVGKTSLAIHLAVVAARAGVRVLLFSLEMDADAIARRIACRTTGRSWRELTEMEQVEREYLISQARELPIVLYERYQASIVDILGFTRREAARGPVGLVIVDHIQMVGWVGDQKLPRHLQLGIIARRFVELSGALRVPVVSTAQLNPPPRQKGDKAEPSSDDLRDSKEPFNACSVFAVLHQPRNKSGPTGDDALLIQKNRFGPVGRIKIEYDYATARVSQKSNALPFGRREEWVS